MRGWGYVLRSAWFVALVGSLLLFTGEPLNAQEPHRAGLVVQFGDGTVLTRCITFTEDEISGEELLRRSGLRVLFDYMTGLGTRVCQIEDEGCEVPNEDCWCQCQSTPCFYWNYFYVAEGRWRYSNVGCGARKVRDGDIEGWIWGDGRTTPALFTLEDICGPSESTPEPTPTTTLTPALVTPAPATTDTPQSSPTSVPTAAQEATPSPTPTPGSEHSTTPDSAPSPPSLNRYAPFAIIVLALGGTGLFLLKRWS